MTVETEVEIHRRQTVMGGEIEFLENFEKKHDQIDDGGNDGDSPDFVKDPILDFK